MTKPVMKGQLYIIAAPSGAGKTSLVSALIETLDDLCVSISHTTRPQRAGELDGENYFFVDDIEFKRMREANEFLESAEVFGHFYGTTRKWVTETLNQGVDVILEIDWQGARLVRELVKEAVGIFILPPSMSALKQRLTVRAADDEAVIQGRMEKAKAEISHFDEFDYLVVNDQFEQALDELTAIIKAQRLRLGRQQVKCRDLLHGLLHE